MGAFDEMKDSKHSIKRTLLGYITHVSFNTARTEKRAKEIGQAPMFNQCTRIIYTHFQKQPTYKTWDISGKKFTQALLKSNALTEGDNSCSSWCRKLCYIPKLCCPQHLNLFISMARENLHQRGVTCNALARFSLNEKEHCFEAILPASESISRDFFFFFCYFSGRVSQAAPA